eukprot:Phypoly_transcript_03136.p1 GENE.Phypoly_transcript_03136~~Phypoly_transcript_03136.p1  ORF type:complete len:220 (+),score=14.08 Phypoly_transcript_03136:476-1135(+)
MIKMRIDIELNKSWYRKCYLVFALGFPLVMGLASVFGFETGTKLASPCVVVNPLGIGLITYPNFVLVIVQFILITWSMAYVRQVVSSVQSTANQFSLKILIVRFVASFLSQLYTVFATQIYALFPSSQTNAIFARFTFVSHANGGTVDALILILGNADFVEWLKSTFENFRRRNSQNSSSEEMHSKLSVSVTVIDPQIDVTRRTEMSCFEAPPDGTILT